MIGLYKAVRDFRPDKETSFRSFAELCVTRQIISAIKTATRFKHSPLNSYVSFSHTPAGQDSDGLHARGRPAGTGRRRPVGLRDLDRGARRASSSASARASRQLESERRSAAISREAPKRDGRGARLRHEDDRQRSAARQAEDPRAPEDARGSCLRSLRIGRRLCSFEASGDGSEVSGRRAIHSPVGGGAREPRFHRLKEGDRGGTMGSPTQKPEAGLEPTA